MKVIAVALAVMFTQQPRLPQQLNVSQIATTSAGSPGATAQVLPPAASPVQQLPATQLEVEPQVGTGTFTVEVADQDLRLLLSLVSAYFGLNVVMDRGIEETVSLNLIDVTLDEALEVILDPLELEYQLDGDLLRVNRPQMENQTFEFDYVTTQRTLSRSLSASASTGGGGGGSGGGTVTGGGGGGGSSTSISGSEQTDLLGDIEAALQQLKSENGSVVYNQMAGLIFATDFNQNLDMIGTYLEMVQNAVNRQVIIEARIIEVKLNDDFQAGIDWSAIVANLSLTQAFGTARSGFTMQSGDGNFSALVQALNQRGTVNVLSSPTVATLNNQPAVMRVGTQDVFFTTTTQVDPRTGTIVQTATQANTINEGVVLDVTPNISADGIITMNIHPTITERTGQATSPDGSSVPIVDVRESDTIVRVAEGETIVISGLISDRTLEAETRVPVLGSLPLIGNLFKRVNRESRKTDMVILLTPTIVTMRTVADYARQRIEAQEKLKNPSRQ